MYHLKAAALLCGPLLLFSTTASAVGGRVAWWIAGLLSLANAACLWRLDRFLLRRLEAIQIEEQAAPGLFAIVQTLARRQHLRLPSIHILRTPASNALFVSRGASARHIVLTAGLLEALSTNELAAVIAYQMSRLASQEAFIMTVAASYSIVLERLGFSAILVTRVARLATPASAHFRADALAAHLVGDAAALIESLRKIEEQGLLAPTPEVIASRHLFICEPLTKRSSLRPIGPTVAERVLRLQSLTLRSVPAVAP